jgi:hypothetical protein
MANTTLGVKVTKMSKIKYLLGYYNLAREVEIHAINPDTL